MTDEELAEGWVTDNTGFNSKEPLGKIAIRIFLGGLKAGKPEWHKVAEGDYPPLEKDGFSINIFTDRGEIAYYNHDFDYWIAEPASVEIDPPVAWCEIPKYKE